MPSHPDRVRKNYHDSFCEKHKCFMIDYNGMPVCQWCYEEDYNEIMELMDKREEENERENETHV